MTESNKEDRTWVDRFLSVGKIREALTDDESRMMFDTRIDNMITRNDDYFFDIIESLPYKWRCTQLEPYMDDGKTNIIIFGCGHDGKITNRILKKCEGLSARYYCDSYRSGQVVDGLEVISVDELLEKYIKNTVVVLGTSKYQNEIFSMLIEKGYPEDRIVKPYYGVLIAQFGHQYFDFFSAEQDEIFVDAGAFNGDTTIEFASWAGNNYKKAFVLEPQPDMCLEIENKIQKVGLTNVVIENCAAWDKDEELLFSVSGIGGSASRPDADGELLARGKTIDDIVDGEKVTYIKMDVEGSELKALAGAKRTILKYKPKLAISIYHKPYDVIGLADYILELVPEYHLGIRHYFSNTWETVVYAYI